MSVLCQNGVEICVIHLIDAFEEEKFIVRAEICLREFPSIFGEVFQRCTAADIIAHAAPYELS